MPSSQRHKQEAWGLRPGWEAPAAVRAPLLSRMTAGPMPLDSRATVLRVVPGIRMHEHTGHQSDWEDPSYEVCFPDGDSYRVHIE